MSSTCRLTSFSVLALAVAACVSLGAPAYAAVNKEDRKLCSEAKEDDAASLLRCIKSLNDRLAEIEDEPEEIEAPDDTDQKIAALQSELSSVKTEAAAATEAAKMATEQAAAANVKIDALAELANKMPALEASVAEAKAAAANASALADRAGTAADIAIEKAEAAAAKADAAAREDSRDDRGDDDGKEGSYVKAPFSVVDDSGAAILTVEVDGSNAVLTLGPPDAYAGLIAGADGAGVIAAIGERAAKMEVTEGTTSVTVADPGEGSVAMGHIDGAFSGFIYSKEQAGVANLGVTKGGAAALRIFNDDGSGVFSAGSNPAQGGAGAMFIGNGDKNGIEAEAYSGGSGEVRVMGDGDNVAVAMRGKERTVQVVGDNGTAIAELSPSAAGGGKINLADTAGNGMFYAGAATDGGGKACIINKGKEICLGLGLPPVGGR